MEALTLQAVIDENHRLIVDVPADVPVGPVEVVIKAAFKYSPPDETMTRETIRAIFRAAGVLSTATYAPPDAVELTPEEEDRLGRMLSGTGSFEDLINEDREERFA